MSGLSPQKAAIFRITHIDNMPWIFANGLHCKNSGIIDETFRNIGNQELIHKRSERNVPINPFGTLSDYIPFYFTPYSPMLYNIKTGYNVAQRPMREIVILESTLFLVKELNIPFVFTDRHAYLNAAQFFNDLEHLTHIDWKSINNRDFRKKNTDDLERIERYQAEALIKTCLPIKAIHSVVCYSEDLKHRLESSAISAGAEVSISSNPSWYFQ